MISNENKIHLISQQIKGGVTPYSITTSPGIRYDLNDSDEHKQLKFNRYIIDDIMKSQKEYDVMDEKVNEHHVLDGSTRVKSGVAVGTRFKLSDLVECKDRDKVHDGLYAIRYDTHQFNWDSRHFCVYKSELFGPLFVDRGTKIDMAENWQDAARKLILLTYIKLWKHMNYKRKDKLIWILFGIVLVAAVKHFNSSAHGSIRYEDYRKQSLGVKDVFMNVTTYYP
eukprot:885826_1